VDPPLVGGEQEMLDSWVDYQRSTLLLKCEGLGDDQRKRRPVATSLLSLHGLVRHMTDVERYWFQAVLCRSPDIAFHYWEASNSEGDWTPLDEADWDGDLGLWQDECGASRETARGRDLDTLGLATRDSEQFEVSLRWILNHMIEEYARHNGHADLIREMIDGAVGC
jgi:uncharacterized damage-inducible protein DinB